MSAYELTKTILKDSANLKAYYQLESDGTDSSASGFTLTANGTPTYGAGKYNNAVTVSSGNNLYRNSTTDLDITTGALSFGGWVKFSTVQDSDVFGKLLHTGNLNGYSLTTENSGGNNAIHLYYITNFGTAALDQITYVTAINDNNWHLVVATRPASGGSVRLFIDGTHVGSATNNNRNITTTAKYSIGSRNAGATRPFAGSVDDAFVFDTELSADQIKELYEGRYMGEWMPQSGLVGLWHLNGNSTDTSGNNNHFVETAITYSNANGKIAQGAGLNGSTSKLITAGSLVSGTANKTIMFWYYAGSNSAFQFIYSKMLDQSPPGLFLANSSGTLSLTYRTTGDTSFSCGSITLNAWQHIVVVQNASNSVDVYKNGNRVGGGSVTLFTNNSKECFATSDSDNSYDLSGSLDEIAIFSRALTAAEIRHFYAWSVGKYI